jgi:hypothetical protein
MVAAECPTLPPPNRAMIPPLEARDPTERAERAGEIETAAPMLAQTLVR